MFYFFSLIFVLLVGSLLIGISAVSGEPQWVPYSLHSVLKADYSADPLGSRLAAVQMNLVGDALNDQGVPDVEVHLATLQVGLLTPVPTVTPDPRNTQSPPGIGPPTATLQAPSSTPTDKPAGTPTSSPTPTPTGTPTGTALPSATPASSATATLPWKPSPTPSPTPPKPTQPPPTSIPPTQPPAPTKPPPTPRPTRPPDPYPGPKPSEPPYP